MERQAAKLEFNHFFEPLVVRSGKTPKELIQQVVANLGREKILGVVFNATDEIQGKNHHYYNYYQLAPEKYTHLQTIKNCNNFRHS